MFNQVIALTFIFFKQMFNEVFLWQIKPISRKPDEVNQGDLLSFFNFSKTPTRRILPYDEHKNHYTNSSQLILLAGFQLYFTCKHPGHYSELTDRGHVYLPKSKYERQISPPGLTSARPEDATLF